MDTLAIDPGTITGWALLRGSQILSGTWDLKGSRWEGGGMRFVRLRNYLHEIGKVDQVLFEEVRRHLGTDAAHVFGGMIATIQAWCEDNQIPYQAIPVGTIKRMATGKGNADKTAMLEAARAKWPDQQVRDDNQADALWLLEYGLSGA
ncbi:MAG: hypothetical protein V1736_07125 [Pseudomonadota bacterium]